MNMIPVTSSNIRAIGYDRERRQLRIDFKAGGSRTYSNVPPEAHSALMGAESHGKHFNQHIRRNPDYGSEVSAPAPADENARQETAGHDEPASLDAAIRRFGGEA